MARRPRKPIAKRRTAGRPVREDGPGVGPPPRRRHNLPIQLTTFIGREREIAGVQRLLTTAPLLTLTGAGGAGKTRLALRVAAECLEQYPDGVWFVDLAPVADPALVPSSVAAALGVPEQPGRPLADTLAAYLRTSRPLLVLDNCEHLRAACQALADRLLRASETVRVLATSREALGVAGEITYRVPPLQFPAARHAASAADMVRYDALRLFTERAALAQPEFTVTDDSAPTILQICRRLDGMPLAIEFAAARVAALSVEQIAARLDDRLRLLTAGSRQTLPRHQTLRATLDWSHDLLTEREQTLFRRLAVFAGGFTLEAAERVCPGTGIAEQDILDLLTRLVDKSLVVFDQRRGDPRYRLLDSVRQYGQERLEASDDTEAIRRRHRDWYLDFADRAGDALRGHAQDLWLSRMETEHDNLRAALAWSKAAGDIAGWLRLTGALTWFWFMGEHWGEGRRWVEDALAAGGTAEPLSRRTRWGAMLFALAQGDIPRVEELTGNLNFTGAGRDDQVFGIVARIAKGNIAADTGMDHGVRPLEEAVAQAHALGDRWLLAFALTQLSVALRKRGHYDRAVDLCAESARLFEALGDRWRHSIALRNLGITMLRRGSYDEAVDAYAKSIRLRAPEQNRWVVFQGLEGLACVECARAHYERAAVLFAAAAPVQEALRARRDSDFLAEVQRYGDRARMSLSGRAFEAAQIAGRAMTLEQAIEYALPPAKSEPASLGQEDRGPADSSLTGREREVARLVARGLTNRQIAAALVVSERTAEGHVQSILNKLSFNTRAQVAVWAVEHGLHLFSA